MIKMTKKQTEVSGRWGSGSYSAVGPRQININEADFTAAPSPPRFDLLDSYLLGRPVRLQKRGEGTREEEGLCDRGWNEPLAPPASRSTAESFIIGASGPAESKWWGPKRNH